MTDHLPTDPAKVYLISTVNNGEKHLVDFIMQHDDKIFGKPAVPVLAIYYISTSLLSTQYIFSKLEASTKFFSEKNNRSVVNLLVPYNALEYAPLEMPHGLL